MSDLKSKPQVIKKLKFEQIDYKFVNAANELHKFRVSKDKEENILIADFYYGYDLSYDKAVHEKYTPNLMTKEQFKEYANLLKEFADSLE